VLMRSDNAAIVSIITSGVSKDLTAINLLWCLTHPCATRKFRICATHIRGVSNILADALSRKNLPLFLPHYPQANKEATHISAEILDAILLRARLDCQRLDHQVEFYLDYTLALSIKKTCGGSAKKWYMSFCYTHNTPPFPLHLFQLQNMYSAVLLHTKQITHLSSAIQRQCATSILSKVGGTPT